MKGWKLPKLYKLAAKTLRLAPDQYSEDVFKQILGGCATVIDGLGSLRNKFSDAHGRGRLPVRPAARHAELAVNLAGALALFLVSTAGARAKPA
jgi:Abortive infection C-terminus